MGDLNVYLLATEKQGGARANIAKCRELFNFLHQSALQDMGFSGPRFTWRRGSLQERLDRALCNNEWRIHFPDSGVTHLTQLKSDHRPIMLKLKHAPTPPQHDRPFRFQACWLTHDNFKEFMQASWMATAGFQTASNECWSKLRI